MKIKALTGAVLALALGLGGLAFAGPAQAHTPTVSSTCEALTVDLLNYQAGHSAVAATYKTVKNPAYKPAVAEVSTSTYTRYSSKGVYNGVSTPLTAPGEWQADHKPYDGVTTLNVVHEGGGAGSYFYWKSALVVTPGSLAVGTPTIQVIDKAAIPATTNTVKVTVAGVVVEDTKFSTAFNKVYTFADKYFATAYRVQVTAWDDARYSIDQSGTSTACTKPTPTPTPTPTPPAIIAPCTATTSGGTATDLNANGWNYTETRATGHNDYVAGGLNVYTEGATSTDKAAGYHAVGLPLGKIGVPSMLLANISGGHPGLQLGVDRDGDGKWDGYLVNEGDTYGAGKWWTSKPGFGVASGDGYKSLGTLNQYFAANRKAVVLSVGYSLGSGVLGNVVIKSITAGCKTYTFDLAATPVVPEPKVVVTSSGTPDCKAGTVAIITTTTTTGIFALQGKVLVAKPDTVVPVTTTRDATIKECPAVVVVPPTSPISVDPELPTFTDAACTDASESTTPKYTIPTTKGVQYQQSSDGIKFTDVEKGSYTVAVGSKIWVKPVAQPGYVLKSSTVSKHSFSAAEDCQLPPLGLLTPMASSTRITCDTAGSYTVVNDEGLIWLVDGVEKPAGTYVVSQPSTVRVVATTDPSKAGLEANAQTEWMFTFTKPICQLTTLALPGSNGTLAFTGSNGKLASGLLLGLIFMIVGAGAMTVNHVRRRTN